MPELNNGKGVLGNGLPASVMRQSMENKNLLSKKGALYAGMGVVNTAEVAGQTYDVPQTTAVNPPATAGTGLERPILAYTGEGNTGLSWTTLAALGLNCIKVVFGSTSWTAVTGTNPKAAYSFTTPVIQGLSSAVVFTQLTVNGERVESTIDFNSNSTITVYSNSNSITGILSIVYFTPTQTINLN